MNAIKVNLQFRALKIKYLNFLLDVYFVNSFSSQIFISSGGYFSMTLCAGYIATPVGGEIDFMSESVINLFINLFKNPRFIQELDESHLIIDPID